MTDKERLDTIRKIALKNMEAFRNRRPNSQILADLVAIELLTSANDAFLANNEKEIANATGDR